MKTALKSLESDNKGTFAKKEVRAIMRAIDNAKNSGTEKKITNSRSSFRSLIEHPEANDGLDGVNIRHVNSSPELDAKAVMDRLLKQLKVIEKHVKESTNLQHLSKVARKLDKVLDSCGIHVKEIDEMLNRDKTPKSFVDPTRFMHVGGATLLYFVDTSAKGVDQMVAGTEQRAQTLLQEQLGNMDKNEQMLILQTTDQNKKKVGVRKGFHPSLRPKVWRVMILGEDFIPELKESEFHHLEKDIWHGHVPEYDELEHHVHVPDFGGPHNLFHSHPITEMGEAAVQRLLCILQHTHPDITYCPFLPDICSVLCLHLPEWEVYHIVDTMLERSKNDEWFFPLSGKRFMCYVESFLLLMQLRMRYDLVLRLMDCFLNEGAKMLFRVGLALLKTNEKMLLSCTNKHQFLNRFAKHMRMHTNVDEILSEAFNIRGFSRRMLSKLHATHEIKEIPFAKVPVFYMPQFKASDSKLMTVTQLRKLWKHLPALMRIQDPVLLFTTQNHGYNLDILLDRTGHQSAFIVIKTQKGSSFGVFLHWREDLAKNKIGEESFVFTLAPNLSCYHYFYSDPKRWGDTNKVPTPQGKPTLGKAQSYGNQQTKTVPDMKRSSSDRKGMKVWNKPPSRARRGSDKLSREKLRVVESNSNIASSAPSSPVSKGKRRNSEEEELKWKVVEKHNTNTKQASSSEIGSWRKLPTDLSTSHERSHPWRFKQRSRSWVQGATQASGGHVSSGDEGDEPPTAASRRKGNQLRMMHALSGNEINLWCRRTPQWFGIGSGDRVALGIDHKLLHGVTESSTAFDNPPLNGEKYHGDFKCMAIEVWGLTH
ncbi:hypothetical protein AAMO2058_001019100 [Amorphochlora amoebiformis]